MPKNYSHKGCDGKVQHKTKLSAEYEIQSENRQASSDIYECKVCGFWHIYTIKKYRKLSNKRIVTNSKNRNKVKPKKIRGFGRENKHRRRKK